MASGEDRAFVYSAGGPMQSLGLLESRDRQLRSRHQQRWAGGGLLYERREPDPYRAELLSTATGR